VEWDGDRVLERLKERRERGRSMEGERERKRVLERIYIIIGAA